LIPIIICLSTFVAMLLAGGPESSVDRHILLTSQQGALVSAARLLTTLGGWSIVLGIAAVAAMWLMIRRRGREALILCVLMVSERGLVELLKEAFDRARPDPHGHLVVVNSMAYPSGHAANAMALGLGLALLAAPKRGRGAAIAAGIAFAVLVGGTRLVLGVHWPSDVVGGWALGAAWTILLVRLFQGTSAPRPH
jgi:undecaprenyl-diphosphatase